MISKDLSEPGQNGIEFRDIAKRSAEAGIADQLNRAYDSTDDDKASGKDSRATPAEGDPEQ